MIKKLLGMVKAYLRDDFSGEEANKRLLDIEDQVLDADVYYELGWADECGNIVEQSEPCLDREWYKFIDQELKDWYLKACEQVGEELGL